MVYPRTLKDCAVELGSTPKPTPLSKSELSIGASGVPCLPETCDSILPALP